MELAAAAPIPQTDPARRPAVEVRGLTKSFAIAGERTGMLRDRVLHPRRPVPGSRRVRALDGVDLRIAAGESVGIAGRNGSGKTTLLRCIAGIYRPDDGSVRVAGEVSSFISLGPAFDPELTARENAVLTAVALGVPIRTAKTHAGDVLAAAGLSEFAGHRLKNLSAGMAARLAFAATNTVAADVLLFDEVFAVGDRAFRRRCEARFEALRASGRTIVLVSHDLDVIRRHCDRAILLDRGRIVAAGDPESVAAEYSNVADRSRGRIGAGTSPEPAGPDGGLDLPAGAESGIELSGEELERLRRGGARVASVAWSLATARFRRRYLDSKLGYAWALLRPLAFFAVLFVVFTQIGRFDEGVEHYGVYLLLSIVLWIVFAEATSTALGSLVRSGSLLRSLPLPAIVVPLSVVLSSLLDLAMNLIAVGGFLLIAGIEPRLSWLELPAIVAVVAALACGTALLLSSLFVRLRDIDQVWTIARQALFYGSPIFYVAAFYPEAVRAPLTALPLAAAFTEARHAIIDPQAPSLAAALGGAGYVLIPVALAFGTLALGIWAALRTGRTAAERV